MTKAPHSVAPEIQPVRRGRVRIVLVALVVFLVATITFLVFTLQPPPRIEWLPPGSLTPSAGPGSLAAIKAKLKNFTAPIWRPLRRNPRQLTIHSTIMRLAPDGSAALRLGVPIATNANGVCAWVVDETRLRNFVPPFDAIGGASPSVTLSEGTRAGVTSGSLVIVHGTDDSSNFLLNFAPKIFADSVQLDVGVTRVALAAPMTNVNLAACRARVPKAGALIVECSQAKTVDQRHYLFIFTPVVPRPGVNVRNGVSVPPVGRAYSTSPPHEFIR